MQSYNTTVLHQSFAVGSVAGLGYSTDAEIQ